MLCLKHIMLAAVMLNLGMAVRNVYLGNIEWAAINLVVAACCQVGYLQEANKE
jgi:hypothetical protein